MGKFFRRYFKMDNKFTQFVELYKDDIKDFVDAFVNFIKALFEKFGANEDAE